MSFLAPLFLFGALAVALPVFFHLIRRSSREKMPFSSLMFLAPVPPRVTRRSRLENILLLILRCLVIGLLAAGFARPYLQEAGALKPETRGNKKTVFLIDASASMRRGNLWAEAVEQARQLVQDLEISDQAAVLVFDRSARTVMDFEEWDSLQTPERALMVWNRLQALEPTWSGTHLANALISAAELFEQTARMDEAVGPREIVLISDLQAGGRLEAIQGFEWPASVDLVIVPVEASQTTNAGLQLVAESEELSYSHAAAGPRVRILNAADSQREEFQIRWEGGQESVEAYVPPGQSRIVQMPQPPAAGAGQSLVLSGDDHDFDNTIYHIELAADQIEVLYLGSEAAQDPGQPLYYLRRAFQQTRRHVVEINAPALGEDLPAGALASALLILITDTVPPAALEQIRVTLAQGRTGLVVLKNPASARNVSELLGLQTLRVAEVSGARYAMLGQIDFTHPLFALFADPRYSDFTKIHFWKYRQIDAAQIPGARVIAQFDDRSPAVLQVPLGRGELFVLCSSWQPSDSQMALSTKFIPLLYSLLEQGGALQSRRLQFAVGDEIALRPANDAAEMVVSQPDGSRLPIRPDERFARTDRLGIYQVTGAKGLDEFAVNMDPLESKTEPLALEQFESFGIRLKQDQPADPSVQAEMKREQLLASQLEAQQKLWRWLVMAALVLLLMETFLAGLQSRRHVAPAA